MAAAAVTLTTIPTAQAVLFPAERADQPAVPEKDQPVIRVAAAAAELVESLAEHKHRQEEQELMRAMFRDYSRHALQLVWLFLRWYLLLPRHQDQQVQAS
jgi:hypothetical protein